MAEFVPVKKAGEPCTGAVVSVLWNPKAWTERNPVSMWGTLNIVGLRRRWGSLENAPGRTARLEASRNGSGRTNGRSAAAESTKASFLAREVLIDCSHAGCEGKILTGKRQLGDTAGTGSRIALSCTREPEEHEITISIEPLTTEEKEALKASSDRNEQLQCKRCGTRLKMGQVEVADAWTGTVSRESAYCCPWCGVKWLVPAEEKVCQVS